MSATANESRRRGARAIAVDCLLLGFISFVVALGVVIGTTVFHGDHVSNRADAKHLQYGFPIAWVTQGPPLSFPPPTPPATVSMSDPRDTPTSASLADLVLDFALVGAAPFGLYWVVVGGAEIARRQCRSHQSLLSATA